MSIFRAENISFVLYKMDGDLLAKIAALPAAKGKAAAVNFARVLADDLKQLEVTHRKEVKVLKKKADGYDLVRDLVKRQATLLEETKDNNDKLEEEILKVLGIKSRGRLDDD